MTGSIENVTVTGVANFKGTVIGITAETIGLWQVENTSDASKPISTATQSALDLKANVADLGLKANVADLDALTVKFENLIKILTASKQI